MDAARATSGARTRTPPRSTTSTSPARSAAGAVSAPPASSCPTTSGCRHDRLRRAGRRLARRHRPRRPVGRAAARPRVERGRHHRPRRPPPRRSRVCRGAGADRRGRRLRLVRQPRHRPPRRRIARRHHGLVPHLARRRRPRRTSGGARRLQRRRGVRRRTDPRRPARDSPGRRSSTARCPSTPGSRPPGRLAGLPVLVAHGDADNVIPRELLERTWTYLLSESGARTVAHRGRGGHQLTDDAVQQLSAWITDRLAPSTVEA